MKGKKEKQGKKSYKKVITLGVTGAILSSTLLAAPSALASEKRSSQPIAPITTTSINYNDLINKIPSSPSANLSLQLDVLRQMDQVKGHQKNFIPFGLIKKALVSAIKYGGPMLGKLVKNLSPRAGKWFTDNSWAIANKIDAMEAWTEAALASALVSIGCPPDVAINIARALMLFV